MFQKKSTKYETFFRQRNIIQQTEENTPKRPKPQQTTAGKAMASVFWNLQRIIVIDYLKHGETINSYYYLSLFLLERLKTEIAKRRLHLSKKKLFIHQDNAPCHKSMKTMAKMYQLGFELLPHPACRLDLATSDYHLFSDLKNAQ